MTSCLTPKESTSTECAIITFRIGNKGNYNGCIKLINSVVFDTTATLIHGYVTDKKTNKPLENAFVKFYDGQEQYLDTTNSKCEFEFFKNISKEQWNLKIVRPQYECLIINDIIHAGGQWFDFKLSKE